MMLIQIDDVGGNSSSKYSRKEINSSSSTLPIINIIIKLFYSRVVV